MSALAPVPLRVRLTDGKTWLVDSLWARWLVSLLDRVNSMAMIQTTVSATLQTAAIASTDFSVMTVAGLYRVSYTLNLTRAATTSSSLAPTFTWVYGGVTYSQSGAAMTGNTTSTQQNGQIVMNLDAGTMMQYAVAYASVGATSARYTLAVAVESFE